MSSESVSYSRSRTSELLGRAMPWLFLSLRRALIPTGCLAILGILFYVVPQSREVLGGLAELPGDGVLTGSSAVLVQLSRLLCYIGTSIGLALAVWYAARLLCTVEARLGRPVLWEINRHDKEAEAGVRWATRWLPRVYGVAAMAGSVGAFTYACYGPPRLGQLAALGLVAFGIAAALAVEVGRTLGASPENQTGSTEDARASVTDHRAPTPHRVGGRLLKRIGWVAVGISLCMYAVIPQVLLVKVLGFGTTILPAVLLYCLVERRRFLRWLFTRNVRYLKGKRVGNPEAEQDFDVVFGKIILVICAGVLALLGLAVLSPKAIRAVGSAAAVMLFLSAAVLSLTGFQLLLRRVSRSVPGLTTAVVLVLTVLIAVIGHEPTGNEHLEKVDAVPVSAPPDGRVAEPRFVVNAYGGGIRSAIYTAEILAFADDASCGEFGKHIAAFSGVSGGSLGVATYLLARQELAPKGLWKNCDPSKNAPLTKVVSSALVQDHLSPAIARAVSLDLLPWVTPKRGQALLDSWKNAFADALTQDDLMKNRTPDVTFGLPLSALDGAISPKPIVFFNATDADRGQIFSFSNEEGAGASNLVGLAVLHSARFPIVSPTGAYPANVKEPEARLVDGGYADNSGAQTLATRFRSKPDSLKLIDIDGNPPDRYENSAAAEACGIKPRESSVPTALLALLRARSAHAEAAATDLARSMPACIPLPDGKSCVYNAIFNPEYAEGDASTRCERVHEAHVAPLGWYVGTASAYWIAKSARQEALDLCNKVTGKSCVLPQIPDR